LKGKEGKREERHGRRPLHYGVAPLLRKDRKKKEKEEERTTFMRSLVGQRTLFHREEKEGEERVRRGGERGGRAQSSS